MVAQERHSEVSFGRVFGANEEPEAEGADRKRPRGDAVAAPSAYDPADDDGHEPNATSPTYVVPHVLFTILHFHDLVLAETRAPTALAARRHLQPARFYDITILRIYDL